jgi:hypothetical protein
VEEARGREKEVRQMDHSQLTADLVAVEAAAIPEELAPFDELRSAREEELLTKRNVVGVGAGKKISEGDATDTDALMVLVSHKVPLDMLAKSDRIPKTMDQRPTDVLEVGELFAEQLAPSVPPAQTPVGIDPLALKERVRPVRPGYSVGHPKVTAGTIGAGCYDTVPYPSKPVRYYILSNNHVLANSNDANVGDPILQPGSYDGGVVHHDAIGRLARFVPIKFDGTCNYVDAAIAEVPFHVLDRDIYWIGYPASAATAAAVGMLLKKAGRTTNFTTGRVTVVGATVNVNFGGGKVARFCNQIVTTDMSAGGDSGSLVLDLANNPVGLLFAGSAVATILNPIATVQLALWVRLWP